MRAVGATFKTNGPEARLEVEHAPFGAIRGVVGLQVDSADFSALGVKAFVPTTRTRRHALFALVELAWSGGTLSVGLRFERARVTSDGDTEPTEVKFGPPGERKLNVRSASLSNVSMLSPNWSFTGALSATERAPTSFELFANGVHVATGSFERGDRTLDAERGTNVDWASQWTHDGNHIRVGAFEARFARFIALESTGAMVDVIEVDSSIESFPDYQFRAVKARLRGVEVEAKQRLLSGTLALDLSDKPDLVRTSKLSTGEPLPRVAPLRLMVGLDATFAGWTGRLELDCANKQDRVPATDIATARYTRINATLTRRFDWGGTDALWFVSARNLGDRLAYNATTIQKVRDLAPLPGRSVKAGVRVSF